MSLGRAMADRRPIPLRADPCALRSATVSALARAIIVKAHARLGNRRDEAGIMRSRFPDDPAAMLMPRAASSPTITTTASAVVQTVVADIIAATGAVGAGARLLQSGLLLSFEDGVGMVSVPGIAISANKAAFIEEGAPMVKTKFKDRDRRRSLSGRPLVCVAQWRMGLGAAGQDRAGLCA